MAEDSYLSLTPQERLELLDEADAEGFPPDFESSHNGEVHCFDCYGNLVRRIDVTNVTPPLPFFGNTPP